MSSVFIKKNKKRPCSPPSEANTSFVKNVTARMSGLLPSTITKWFSPGSSNTNGSAPTADSTDSSTDDEGPDIPVDPTPAKRSRYNTPSPVKYEQYSTADQNYLVSNIQTPAPSTSGYVKPFPNRRTLKSQLRAPSEEDAKETSDKDMNKKSEIFQPQHTVSKIGQSVATKRKSIFQTYDSEESKHARAKSTTSLGQYPKQPYFKPTLLASPFYPSRTMYGGASAYVNQPNIKQQKDVLVNESKSKDNSGISGSARRIIDLLEQYSSPLIDAKRIPHYTKTNDDSINNTLRSLDRSAPYPGKGLSYKTQELHIPTKASIMRIKQKARLMESTSAARQLMASHSSTIDYPTSNNWHVSTVDQNKKMTTKIKSNLARTNRRQHELEVGESIDLPTAVLQLEQDKLPKINFGSPVVSSQTRTESTPKSIFSYAETQKSPETPSSKDEGNISMTFKFSNPIRISCDASENVTPPKFVYHSPDRSIDKKISEKKDFLSVVGNVKESEKAAVKSNDWKCADCWVSNKSTQNKCVCCGAKQPTNGSEKAAKCAVCKLADCQPLKDKCVNCEKVQVGNLGNQMAPKLNDSSKWKCGECWVSNNDTAEKCACCGAGKPKKDSKTPPVAPNTPIAPKRPAETSADWKCEDCWISNKSSVDKCAACGGVKPGAKQSPLSSPSVASIPHGISFNKQYGAKTQTQKAQKWECPTCLVKNDLNKSLCICCGAEREGTNKVSAPKFNFGMNTSFKFGIDPKVQEVSLAKKPELETQLETKLKDQSEKNNNILSETPTFTFTLPVKKPEVKLPPTKSKTDEAPKLNFTFGMPPSSTAAPPAATKPLSPVKTVQEEKEKPQEVPKINFSSPVSSSPIQEKPKPLGGMFSSPFNLATNKVSPSSAPDLLSQTLGTRKDGILTPIKPAVSITDKSPQQNTFSFGDSALKTAVFGSLTTTATPTDLFTSPSQTTAATSANAMPVFKSPVATVSSLFQKPNPATTSTVTLFQNSETSSASAPASVATTAPMFGFGNSVTNATSSMPAAEKPSFFSFGNTAPKTEASSSMFKSPFGAPTETTNNNSFGISTGNTLGGGSMLSSNPLGNNNGLSSGSLSIGNNMSTSNPLGGSNGLSSNPLGGGNGLQTGNNGLSSGSSNMFSSTVQKESAWTASSPSSTNLFVSNTTSNSMQKPSTFAFGASTPFNASSTPAFGSNAQPVQNIFGMANQNNNNNSTMFSSPVQSNQPSSIFGAPQQQAANAATQLGLFGSSTGGATPAFGSQNTSLPSFETPTMTAAPTPSFNFGGQQSTGVFGFGQQQQQPQQAGLYNFGSGPAGAAPASTPSLFNMGSGAVGAGPMAGRRVRKAVRRNPPR